MTSRQLRTVFLGHSAQLSGAELALFRVLPAMKRVEPLVLLAQDGPLADALRSSGIPVEIRQLAESTRNLHREQVTSAHVVAGAGSTAAYAWNLSRRLRQLQPDVVHLNSLKACVYGSLAARLAGVPSVWHARDRIAADYLPARAVGPLRLLARTVPTRVVANSASTWASLRLPGPATVVPSPAADEFFAVRAAAADVRCIGMVGRLSPWKGQDVFLRAFALAFPTGPVRAKVIGSAMFGETSYAESLEQLVQDLELQGRVDLVGFRSEVARELEDVDVLVNASTAPEPFGQVVVEALAAGRPVIAAAHGGPAEVLTDGLTGLLFPPGDVDELARALQRVAGDVGLRTGLTTAGRSLAQSYTVRAVAGQLEAVLLSAADR